MAYGNWILSGIYINTQVYIMNKLVERKLKYWWQKITSIMNMHPNYNLKHIFWRTQYMYVHCKLSAMHTHFQEKYMFNEYISPVLQLYKWLISFTDVMSILKVNNLIFADVQRYSPDFYIVQIAYVCTSRCVPHFYENNDT